jgi:hypothetical protein
MVAYQNMSFSNSLFVYVHIIQQPKANYKVSMKKGRKQKEHIHTKKKQNNL